MQPIRIMIANEPRLLRELLFRTIQVFPEFEVVGEIHGLVELIIVVRRKSPQWVILSLTPSGQLPKVVEPLLAENPFLGIVALSTDGSRVVMRWMEHQEVLENISFNRLTWVLRQRLPGEALLYKNGKSGIQ